MPDPFRRITRAEIDAVNLADILSLLYEADCIGYNNGDYTLTVHMQMPGCMAN